MSDPIKDIIAIAVISAVGYGLIVGFLLIAVLSMFGEI